MDISLNPDGAEGQALIQISAEQWHPVLSLSRSNSRSGDGTSHSYRPAFTSVLVAQTLVCEARFAANRLSGLPYGLLLVSDPSPQQTEVCAPHYLISSSLSFA
jgi:hypothetical protein